MRDKLVRGKECAQDRKLANDTGWDVLTFGDLTLCVEPEGKRVGKGRKGQYFAFRLTETENTVQIQDRNKPNGTRPNVMVRSNGMACLTWGGMGCLERGRNILRAMGAIIVKERLSRVDMALDLPGVDMDEFVAAFQERRYITRAKGRGFHESSGITIYLGKSPLMIRIYDKAAEMQSCRNPVKEFYMMNRRWHGVIPEKAIRVEFELGRQALKEHGIDTPDDYFRKRADLAAYLCGEWVRFTACAVDRTHTSLMAVLPLWLTVADGFKEWTGKPACLPLTPLDHGQIDVSQLEKQAVGVFLTAALTSGKATTVQTFRKYCGQAVEKRMPEPQFQRETKRRCGA